MPVSVWFNLNFHADAKIQSSAKDYVAFDFRITLTILRGPVRFQKNEYEIYVK